MHLPCQTQVCTDAGAARVARCPRFVGFFAEVDPAARRRTQRRFAGGSAGGFTKKLAILTENLLRFVKLSGYDKPDLPVGSCPPPMPAKSSHFAKLRPPSRSPAPSGRRSC